MNANGGTSRLSRRLNLHDAVTIGLGSMIGAGIFAAPGPSADAAGSGLLIGVLIAGILAYLNATTMAQLAGIYPESGGTYIYGRRQLGNFWGFLAGWGFVIGKMASCTAMALTFANYAYPESSRLIAASAVLGLTLINYLGVKKTALATRILVLLVLTALAVVAFAALFGGATSTSRLSGWTNRGGITGILQAAGMMFFAFAGYARIATLGEEVIDPQKNIPKAIITALGITILVYFSIITTAIVSVDIETLAKTSAPLTAVVESGRFGFLSPVVRIGACLASLGVLLSLLAGVSRTIFAMAANRDLPHFLSRVHPVHKVPHIAELTLGLVVASVVALTDIRSAIGFSSFAILMYYAIANAAAWTLSPTERMRPKWMSAAGFLVCMVIAFSLPGKSIIGGVFLFMVGSIGFWISRKNNF